jgi:hypothetical protein
MNALLMAVALAILGVVFMLAPNDGGPGIMLLLPLVALVSVTIYRPTLIEDFYRRYSLAGID